jgi:hypothetical protein
MQERYPESEDSQESKEGDASHWAAEQILSGGAAVIGQSAPNGIILTDDMISNACVFTNDILTTMPPGTLNVENTVKAPAVHAESWGSPDCWAYDAKSRTLYIWDYKYGYGLVEVFENWQLINYIAGIIDRIRMPDYQIRIKATVVQPRAPHPDGPVRRWVVKGEDLRPYINQLHNAAHEALGDDPSIKSGGHCRYCTARHACPAAHKAAMLAVDVTNRAEPHELDDQAIGTQITVLRRAAKAIEYRLTALEAQAESKIRQGRVIPGWCLEAGKAGNLSWDKSDLEVLALGELLGVHLSKPMTPTQAISAGVPKELIEVYASRSPGALKLTKADNTKAAKVFGGNNE